MSRSAPPPEPAAPAAGQAGISRFSDAFDALAERFDRHGALGVLVISVPELDDVEAHFGESGRTRALAQLAAHGLEIAGERLDVDDLIVLGEHGYNELIVLLFRELGDGRFLRQELPGFDQGFRRLLHERGARALYPYLREAPQVVSGVSVVMRNPRFATETQVRRALLEAREDADLNSRLGARKRRRRMLELVLDRSVSSVYEPIVEVSSKTVYGYEALARGPVGTDLHSPLALFALAQEQELVFELDCLCRHSGLKGAVGLPTGTKLFLNIRPTTIHDPNFRAERLIKTLHECKLSPSDVVFEVSEQESIANFRAFREIRDYYRELGFQFALDDTGAGYAGLEALLEISPDFIKVDRSFVSGVDTDDTRRAMLSALHDVANKTGARLIAEGLDTLEELETLGELGIPFGQGWLFGKPTPLRADG